MPGVVRTMSDGFATTISFTGAGTTFEEITVQPPGFEGGEAIDTSTMRNKKYRTKAPRLLIEMTNGDITVSYDPTAYTTFEGLIQINQLLVVTFPDLGTLTFWGYAKTFTPDALEEGKRPTAKIAIVATLTSDAGLEVAPVLVAGAGTG